MPEQYTDEWWRIHAPPLVFLNENRPHRPLGPECQIIVSLQIG